MKKIIGGALISIVLLTACADQNAEASLGRLEAIGKEKFTNNSYTITIFKDKETGCQYMNIDAANGPLIEPILNSEGKPYCPQK
ncbi:hypothetical protein B7492_32300 (plasmid) [Bacillus mycoides]|uniref:DUF6440 domain-containing protein n=1 Tax=Bacillus mycoides TaxID=1405 RepID=A0A1W6AIQ6_BACMY|nr:DUF6440 family protein [Bacillus mycoides]ARJ25723.1 hypothetical protein B7492_32300 [Bacillus mycoides]